MSRPPPQQARQIPTEGSIEPAKVVRIEAYGAFCELTNFYRLRGLVHISQLAGFKVEQVQDVVAVDDAVWVKVLQVEQQENPNGPHPRYKISLSLKDASQDGEGTDLGAAAEQQHALTHQIQSKLQSSIGLGFALDPMAHAQKLAQSKSNLVLKESGVPKTMINGYALVDDHEGELPQAVTAKKDEPTVSAAVVASNAPPAKPMGRGRGTTLPAWMTRKDEGPVKTEGDENNKKVKKSKRKRRSPSPDRSGASSSSSKDDRKKSRKQHRDRKSSRRADKRSDREEERRRRKHKKEKRRRHSCRSRRHRREDDGDHSNDDDSVDDDDKFDDAASSGDDPSDKDRRSRQKRRHKSRSRSQSRSRSRSPEARRRRKDNQNGEGKSKEDGGDVEFQSIEEAQRLIQELERKRKERATS